MNLAAGRREGLAGAKDAGLSVSKGSVGACCGVAQGSVISVAYLTPLPDHQRVGLESGESMRNLTNYSFLCVG